MYNVLPPPPKYPAGSSGGPVVETANLLELYKGPDFQLVVGEGTYILRDELHLATPPPHPSEAPIVNPNPLATSPSHPTAGTKLSDVIVSPKYASHSKHARPETPASNTSGGHSSTGGSYHEKQSSRSSGIGSALRSNEPAGGETSGAPIFGHGNPALTAVNGKPSKDPSKQRKPKNNIIKSNSSFVSRAIPHDALAKRLQEHQPDGSFAIANINRAVQWLDLSSTTKVENLTKILFTKAHALCHDINNNTKSLSHLDVILGFSTADIIWYEPMAQKYARLNKNGIINAHPVGHIKWIPGSENLFLAAHSDGTLVVYDKEKEDAVFNPEETTASAENGTVDGRPGPHLQVKKSWQSKSQKSNPVAVWKVSNQKINDFAFSPDGRHLAVASEDGSLRVIEIHKEQLIDVFMSYYGGMMCCCWSPDGRYILSGGQDDLVSIWSLADSVLVARCQGHNSWVTAVAFDPWRCDERNYRFGSVGEDCRLLLWDFSVGMLHRPRASSVRQRPSISSAVPYPRDRAQGSTSMLRSDSNLSGKSLDYDDIVHPVQARARTATLPPVMAKVIDDHPLCWLGFEEDCIMTSCEDGHIKTWNRPAEGTGSAKGTHQALAAGRGDDVVQGARANRYCACSGCSDNYVMRLQPSGFSAPNQRKPRVPKDSRIGDSENYTATVKSGPDSLFVPWCSGPVQ